MNALRIFAHVPQRRVLTRPGRPAPVPSIEVIVEHEPETIDVATERRIINILESAPQFGETIDAAYRRKECALAELFAVLTRVDAANLQRRLEQAHADDPLAQRFLRLVSERRTRLLALLADIPRRRAR